MKWNPSIKNGHYAWEETGNFAGDKVLVRVERIFPDGNCIVSDDETRKRQIKTRNSNIRKLTPSQMTPGIHLNLPASEYHRESAISASHLRKLWQTTPAHYIQWLNEPEEPTIDMILGTLCHQAILEPGSPLPQIMVPPETYPAPADSSLVKTKKVVAGDQVAWSWNAKYCKQWRQNLEDRGIIVCSESDEMRVRCAAKAIARHTVARELIDSIKHTEVSILCDLPQFGLRGKARLDIVPRMAVLGDLKFTHDASTRAFQDHSYKMGYHIQAAWYLDMWNAVAGSEDRKEGFRIVAVESDPPYAVNVLNMKPDLIEDGRRIYTEMLELYARCKKSDDWPAYGNEAVEMGKPYWVK